jgi:methionyl-tRNA formyltransferase
MKIAYFGYDFFSSCFERLLQDGHEVLCLFTLVTDNKYNFNEKVTSLAVAQGISVRDSEVSADELRELQDRGCELLVVAAYPYRVPMESTTLRGINVHPTLLPEGRGRWPLPYIILKNLRESGVSIHKLTPEFDSGAVLAQARFSVDANENMETLSCKCQLVAAPLLTQVLRQFDSYWAKAVPQDDGSRWPMPSDQDMMLDWTAPVAEINRVVRAYGKMHSTAKFDGKRWNVAVASVWEEPHTHQPGSVVLRTNAEVLIAARNGFVCLRIFEEET